MRVIAREFCGEASYSKQTLPPDSILCRRKGIYAGIRGSATMKALSTSEWQRLRFCGTSRHQKTFLRLTESGLLEVVMREDS
jgi:hypothetical protein